MRTLELQNIVRRRVNDTNGRFFTDGDVLSEMSLWHRDLFRRKCEADETWGLCRIKVLKTDPRIEQMHSNVWRYRLPSFVYRVLGVIRIDDDVGAATAAQGRDLVLREYGDGKPGWMYDGDNAIRIQGFADKLSVWLEVAKVPATLVRGVTVAGSTTTAIKVALDQVLADNSPVSFDLEDQALVNGRIEITALAAANDARGVIATIISTSRAGATLTLNVAPALPAVPNTGDSFDMHFELSDANLQLLALRVQESLLMKQTDAVPLGILREQIKAAEVRFVESLQPRSGGGPRGTAQEIGGLRNPDKDPENT